MATLTWDQCYHHNWDRPGKTLQAQWGNRTEQLASQTAFLPRAGCLRFTLDWLRMVKLTSQQGRYTWSREEEAEICATLRNPRDACSPRGSSHEKLEAFGRRLENMGNSGPWSPTLMLTQGQERAEDAHHPDRDMLAM